MRLSLEGPGRGGCLGRFSGAILEDVGSKLTFFELSGQFRVTSYKKGLKKCFFENLGERPIEMY